MAEAKAGVLRIEWTALERTGGTPSVTAEIELDTGSITAARSFAHWSDLPAVGSHVFVVPDVVTLFALSQCREGESIFPFVFVAPVYDSALPADWLDARYWGFERVTVLTDSLAAPGPVVALLSEMGLPAVGIADPPYPGSWRAWARSHRRLTYSDLVEIETRAMPASEFQLVSIDGRRAADWLARACRQLDDQGRLCRLATLPCRSALSGKAAETVLVRSDRSSARVKIGSRQAGETIASTGTSAAPVWAPTSAAAFLDGAPPPSSEVIGRRLMASIQNVGVDTSSARTLAAYIALTYVFQLFDELPLLVVRGGGAAARFALRRLIATTAHDVTVVSRSRAMHLARVCDAGSGVLLLVEPGPMSGPSGRNELGRFLEAALTRDASSYGVLCSQRVRTLDVFGPKVVFALDDSEGDLACPIANVSLPQVVDTQGDTVTRLAPGDMKSELYLWAMHALGRIRVAARGSTAERVLPIIERELFGEAEISPLGTTAYAPTAGDAADVTSPSALMGDVMATVGTHAHVAMIEVMLEIAIRGGKGEAFSPERVGRWLSNHPSVDAQRPTERRRLHGQISRIYPLIEMGGAASESPDAFAFCKSQPCSDCRYDSVCGTVFPDLKQGKNRL